MNFQEMTLSVWSIDLKSTAFFQQGNNLKLASLISALLLLRDFFFLKKNHWPLNKANKTNKQRDSGVNQDVAEPSPGSRSLLLLGVDLKKAAFACFVLFRSFLHNLSVWVRPLPGLYRASINGNLKNVFVGGIIKRSRCWLIYVILGFN